MISSQGEHELPEIKNEPDAEPLGQPEACPPQPELPDMDRE